MGYPCVSACEESACNAGELGSIRGLGRSPGEGDGCPLQYSGLENSMDCVVHGVSKSWTQLSDFHSLTHPYNIDLGGNHFIIYTNKVEMLRKRRCFALVDCDPPPNF